MEKKEEFIRLFYLFPFLLQYFFKKYICLLLYHLLNPTDQPTFQSCLLLEQESVSPVLKAKDLNDYIICHIFYFLKKGFVLEHLVLFVHILSYVQFPNIS